MSSALRSVVLLALATVTTILALPGTASAAPSGEAGYDVSYPQCGGSLPYDRAFAIIGVNGGLSTRANPCLAAQLTWAWGASGAVDEQPRAQVYLNTANPGEVLDQVTTWPAGGLTPYGTCDGTNSMACSWQYGWERAQNSVDSFFVPAARAARVDGRPSSYTWWLDVETMNTWQRGGTDALARNRATLEGMTSYLVIQGGRVGVYSTDQQWTQIVGTVPPGSPLVGRDNWLAGGRSAADARAACDEPALVPDGEVTLSQYVRGRLDRNESCA